LGVEFPGRQLVGERMAFKLTEAAVRNAKPGNKDRKLFDERGVYLVKVLIAFSAVFLAALLLYMTTIAFDEFFMYLQALPGTTQRLFAAGTSVLTSLVLSLAILRKRRAGRLPGDEQ
jgi:hypothetical protein